MRLALLTLTLGVTIGVVIGASGPSLSRARALESFTLTAHDLLIAEAPGCYAECRPAGGHRLCVVRDLDCQAVCRTLPECRPDGTPVQACAVIRRSR